MLWEEFLEAEFWEVEHSMQGPTVLGPAGSSRALSTEIYQTRLLTIFPYEHFKMILFDSKQF